MLKGEVPELFDIVFSRCSFDFVDDGEFVVPELNRSCVREPSVTTDSHDIVSVYVTGEFQQLHFGFLCPAKGTVCSALIGSVDRNGIVCRRATTKDLRYSGPCN